MNWPEKFSKFNFRFEIFFLWGELLHAVYSDQCGVCLCAEFEMMFCTQITTISGMIIRI